MPREKESLGAKCRKYVEEFGKEVFSTNDKVLFCHYCEIGITPEKRSQVTQKI